MPISFCCFLFEFKSLDVVFGIGVASAPDFALVSSSFGYTWTMPHIANNLCNAVCRVECTYVMRVKSIFAHLFIHSSFGLRGLRTMDWVTQSISSLFFHFVTTTTSLMFVHTSLAFIACLDATATVLWRRRPDDVVLKFIVIFAGEIVVCSAHFTPNT